MRLQTITRNKGGCRPMRLRCDVAINPSLAYGLRTVTKCSSYVARMKLDAIIAQAQVDELIIGGTVHDHVARLRSYKLLATL